MLLVTTANEVPGRKITAVLGVVNGVVVRAPKPAQGLMGGLKEIFGGNVESYAAICESSRKAAFERMEAAANKLGAYAIVGMRYATSEFTPGVTEVLAYGTAVKLD